VINKLINILQRNNLINQKEVDEIESIMNNNDLNGIISNKYNDINNDNVNNVNIYSNTKTDNTESC